MARRPLRHASTTSSSPSIGFTLASVLCGVSRNLPMLIFARVLQGLGGGGLLAKAQSHPLRDLPARGAARGAGALRHRRHRRPGPGTGPRRLPAPNARLALDLLHQPAGGHRRGPHVPRLPPRRPRGERRRPASTGPASACSPSASPASRRCWRRGSRTTGSVRASSSPWPVARRGRAGALRLARAHRRAPRRRPARRSATLARAGQHPTPLVLGMGLYGMMFARADLRAGLPALHSDAKRPAAHARRHRLRARDGRDGPRSPAGSTRALIAVGRRDHGRRLSCWL